MVEIGQKLGDYIVESELGGGGMARVYGARHAYLDTLHAIKVLEPKYRADPEARRRFLDEAKIQAKHLDHPDIVKVTNIITTDEVAGLVMELVDGPSLEGLIEKQKQPPSTPEFLAIALPVLAAVGHAHGEGIIHRDLKPANVLLHRIEGGYSPKVTDFGIAKVMHRSDKKSTAADARMGTLAYMSPEQIRRAKDVTSRSDIFSIGAMLYEFATGSLPFDGESDYDVMESIVRGRLRPPEELAPKLDPEIAAAIKRALSADQNDRFATCAEMAQAMGGELAEPRVARAPAPAPGAPRRALRVVALIAAVALGAAAVFFVTTRGRGERADAPAAAFKLDLPTIPPPGSPTGTAGMLPAPVGDSPVRGPADAPLTLVLFVDFEDSRAVQGLVATQTLARLYDESEVRLVLKPLARGDAGLAVARAIRAAHKQYRGWELVDAILSAARIDEIAVAALASAVEGIDMARWRADLAARETTRAVAVDAAMAKHLAVTGGFALAINGVAVDYVESPRGLVGIIDGRLDDALARISGGADPATLYADLMAELRPGAPDWVTAAVPARRPAPSPDNDDGGHGYSEALVGLSPTLGPADAKNRIVVFDTISSIWHIKSWPAVEKLLREHDDLHVTFKGAPYGDREREILQAAMAAHAQGSFWAYHTALLNIGDFDDQSLVAAARAIRLDMERWQEARTSGEADAQVRADMRALFEHDVHGVPTLFINGQRVEGAMISKYEQVLLATKR